MEWYIVAFIIFLILSWYTVLEKTDSNTTFRNLVFPKIKEVFGFDLRALALFRICLALLIISDLIYRALDLRAYYADDGIFPRILALTYLIPYNFSLHLINGSIEGQSIIFFVNGLFAFAMLVGYRTRFAIFVLWIFMISMHNRSLVINDAGDQFLRVIVFWSMFLPLGACYSLDSALNSSKEKLKPQFFSIGTAAYCVQVAMIYWFSVYLKLQDEVWRDGTVVYHVLHLLPHVTEIGLVVSKLPMPVLVFLGKSVLMFELIGPILLFLPFRNSLFRIGGIIGFLLLHFGFGSCIDLEIFPWISSITMLPFIPTLVWDKLFSHLRTQERLNIKLYYNTKNELSKKIVLVIKTFFLLQETSIEEAKEEVISSQDNRSWLVVADGGDLHYDFEALKIICYKSPLVAPALPIIRLIPFKMISSVIPPKIFFSSKVGQFFSGFLSFRSLGFKESNVTNIIATISLVYIFFWTVSVTTPNQKMPANLNWIANVFRIDQRWGMFVGTPEEGWFSGWFVFVGNLKDGTRIDVFRKGQPVSWEKPELSYKSYGGRLWKRYIINVLTEKYWTLTQPYYAYYLCREWNKAHPSNKQLENIQFYFIKWKALLGEKYLPREKFYIGRFNCSGREVNPVFELRELEKEYAYDPKSLIRDLLSAAFSYYSRGKIEESIFLYKKILEKQADIYGENNAELIKTLEALKIVYQFIGNNNGIEEVNKQIEAIKTGTN